VSAIRQLTVMGEVAEPRHRGFELQFDAAGRAMALLADDDFGLAEREIHVGLPFLVFRRAGAGFLVRQVIFLAIDETSRRRRPARSSLIRASRTSCGRLSSRDSTCRDNCDSAITGTLSSLASALRFVVIR